jgi:hypothetical protein
MSILDNAKELATAVHEIKNLELYERVLNLNAGIMDLVEENRQLRAKIEQLEKSLVLRDNMKFKEPFYYQDGDQTPFCPACFETNIRAVHAVREWTDEQQVGWICPTCKNRYVVNRHSLMKP